jgi:uncharacterized RDD family membrane protein YckC
MPEISTRPSSYNPSPIVKYAGFWRRVAASFFDNAVATLVGLGFVIILLILKVPIPQWVSDIFPLLIFWLYFSLMESSDKQATVGKIILGIRVTGIDGNKISFLRATGRVFAKFLSLIALGIGFLMVAFTKRKQGLHDMVSETLVVKRGNSHLWKAILVSIFSFILIIAIVSAYGYFVLWPRITKHFFTSITVITDITEPNKISNIEPQKEQVVSQPKEIISFSESEYDTLLSKPLTGLEGKSVGPTVLDISNFWEGKKPHIWIKVKLPLLPNFEFNRRLTKVTISGVQNKNGQDVYNKSNEFEKPFFQSFTVSKNTYPTQHLSGIRDVHLISGTNENDVVSINGKLTLYLPVEIKELSFNLEDIGKKKDVAGVSVSISAVENSQILWTYQGSGNHFFDIKAYNATGQQLESNFSISPSIEEEYVKPADLKSIFKGEIAFVKIFIVSEIKEREYPFVLSK